VDLFDLDSIELSDRANPPIEKGVLCLCALLARMAYPKRLTDLADLFGYAPSSISRIITDTLIYLWSRYKSLIEWHPSLNLAKMELFADAVHELNAEIERMVWGFIDGTFEPICRPGNNATQKAIYSRYTRAHGIRIQAVCTPDGIISAADGPYLGPVNDNRMARESVLAERLNDVSTGPRSRTLIG
jgi:hypothetical protein